MKLRPHHGLCIYFFEGKGYSPDFVANMKRVIEKLQKNPKLELVCEKDAVCAACPHMKEGICDSFDKVACYDQRVLSLLGISQNRKISFREFEKQIEDKILKAGRLEEVCTDCAWREICHNRSIPM